MSSKLKDIGQDLEVTEDDVREIRMERERFRLSTLMLGIVVVVGSFFAGLLVSAAASSHQSYPYSVATAGPLMAARRGKPKWPLGVVLAILAFLSFFASSSFGVVTLYGAHSRNV